VTPATLARRIARAIQHYGKKHGEPAWDGPVVRLEALSDEDRIAKGGRARGDRPRSVHETWRCANRWCSQWTMHGAHRTGRCNFCQEPRPPHDPAAFGRPRPGAP
jgi:hypothetical protein